tara:strand:- start:83 stop:1222 length:1140 start_codon:yes stop_codon:yes gene_type:complete
MVSDNQTTVRIRNFNCVNQDVKVFYTPKGGDNGINDITDNILRKQINMTTANWGNNFLNSQGGIWVADGETLPYAFSAALDCELLGSTGGGVLTTLTTIVGETIDSFFLRLMEKLATQIGGKTLGSASPMGVQIYYAGQVCYVVPTQYTAVSGSSYVPQSFEITTGSLFPQTNFGAAGYNFGFRLNHPDGWRPFIEISSLDVSDIVYSFQKISGYQQFVESLLNQDLYIEELRRYSNNTNQVNVPIEFKSFDSDGTQQATPQTTVIDPYQAQPALIDYSDIILDGQVYAEVGMLAGEFLELRIQYEAVGILNFEEIMQLDDILREQGVILNEKEITSQEKKDMQEAYSNFSGFNGSEEKDKNKKSLIIAFAIGLIYLMK